MAKKVSKKRTVQAVRYVDGFVLVVPKKKVAKYRTMARHAGKMWMKHGALSFKECVGDELRPETGGVKTLTFAKLTKKRPSETVWFSFIEYASKKQRNEVNKKVMAEMNEYAKKHKDMPMPFDVKRMAWGGFRVSVGL